MDEQEMALYDFMVDEEIATANELNLAYNLAVSKYGWWLGVLQEVMYIRTGYRSIESYIEGEDSDEDFSDDDFSMD